MSVRKSVGWIIERFSATGVASGFVETRKSETKESRSEMRLRTEVKFTERKASNPVTKSRPNQALEPTTLLVTRRADARHAPSRVVAHL
jgi:hypothetical protein